MAISTIGTNSLSDPIAVNATGALTGTVNGLTPQASNMQAHNLIINGDMRIAQAATSITTIGTGAYQACDRWRVQTNLNQTTHTWAQVADAPDGFKYSSKLTVGTGVAPTSGDFGRVYQRIEVQDAKHLQWGTSNPQPVTLSFWVKSSIAGQYGGVFSANGNGVYAFAYNVNQANVWEYKTYTVTNGMTTFGADSNDNGIGFGVCFDLGEGTSRSTTEGQHPTTSTGTMGLTGGVKILATSGATWQITGVQLEAGSTASPFAHEFVGDTLRKCQRYYWQLPPSSSYASNMPMISAGQAWYATNAANFIATFPVTMRASPTLFQSGLRIYSPNIGARTVSITLQESNNPYGASLHVSGASSLSGGQMWYIVGSGNATDYIGFGAEL